MRMDRIPIRRTQGAGPKPSEDGFILLGVIILLALFVIAMAVAAPQIAKSIQRDRDIETMHRGKQYRRAIQLYYRKFNAYPPGIEALVKTNEIRFLRKKYVDPTTGKDDWKPVAYGQQKTQPTGFFGQPLGGTGGNVLAGTGPSGGNGIGGTSTGSTFGSSIFGSSGSSGSSGLGSTGSIFGNDNSTNGNTSNTGTANGTTSGNSGNSSDNSSNGSSGSDSLSGQTFGGGGMIGVSPASTKQSILVYKKKDHYNQWEFLYSPLQDQPVIATTSGTTPGTGIGTGTGNTTTQDGFGFGSTTGSGTGSTGTTTTTPTSPQPF